MKLLGQKLVANQPGTITIIPEQPDDLWLLYNLITKGDIISAPTTRKIQTSSESTNKKNISRVKLELEIKIINVDYDKSCDIIRVRGKTITSNEHVKSGVFHTLELEKNKEFNLMKELWNGETIQILNDHGSDQRATKANLAVILIKEGLAEIFLIGESATSQCATIQGGKITKNNNSGSKKFFENIFVSFKKHIDMDVIPYVVIASCESIKDEFRVYLLLEAQRSKIKSIENNKSRIVLVNKNNVKEILHDKGVMSMMNKDTKNGVEIKVLEDFMHMVSTNSDRACYGTKSVEYAHELMAIETLLITDEILKNEDIKLRQKYKGLVNSVKKAGGKVVLFKTMIDAEQRLAQMTGIAAILRFPMPNIDELDL